MRNKVAKQLRKEARALTVGVGNKGYTTKGINRLTFVLVNSCTRAVYQNLKKEYKSNKSLQFS